MRVVVLNGPCGWVCRRGGTTYGTESIKDYDLNCVKGDYPSLPFNRLESGIDNVKVVFLRLEKGLFSFNSVFIGVLSLYFY